jgi:hypothetical protein
MILNLFIEGTSVRSTERLMDAIAGGWELSSNITANTGTPLDVTYSASTINDVTGLSNDYRGEAELRPNVTGASVSQNKNGEVNNYFNGYTFSTPSPNAPFGDAGRDAFRAPGLAQWDLAANKSFHIPGREGMALQFRSEFFNVTNHTNFGIPNTVSTNSAFGTIRTTYPGRQIQFALKFIF